MRVLCTVFCLVYVCSVAAILRVGQAHPNKIAAKPPDIYCSKRASVAGRAGQESMLGSGVIVDGRES